MEQARQINWVIETKAGQFLGLATIAGLDWKNRMGELVFGFAHELGHIIFDHMTRRGDKEPQVWNMAGDYVAFPCN